MIRSLLDRWIIKKKCNVVMMMFQNQKKSTPFHDGLLVILLIEI